MARAYGHYFPATQIDAVEIDPDLAEIGRRYFDMHAPHLSLHAEDARPWLRNATGDYDVIVLDAYRQPYIPFYLATREFFELVRDRLAPGGVVIVNVGHPEGSTELEKVVGPDDGRGLPRGAPRSDRGREHAHDRGRQRVGRRISARWPGACRASFRRSPATQAARLGPPLEGGEVYTDDRAPVEWLIDRSILGYAAK